MTSLPTHPLRPAGRQVSTVEELNGALKAALGVAKDAVLEVLVFDKVHGAHPSCSTVLGFWDKNTGICAVPCHIAGISGLPGLGISS